MRLSDLPAQVKSCDDKAGSCKDYASMQKQRDDAVKELIGVRQDRNRLREEVDAMVKQKRDSIREHLNTLKSEAGEDSASSACQREVEYSLHEQVRRPPPLGIVWPWKHS